MAKASNPKDPRQELLETYSRIEAKQLEARLPEGIGFCLILFDFGHQQFLSYISNANREDMKATLRELLAHLEGRGS
jgi:hypothetical protein